jgi:hypothetical protein
MPPEALSLAFFLVQEAIKNEPAIAAEIQTLFNKGIPTDDDWANLRARVASKSYRDFVPDSALPPNAS